MLVAKDLKTDYLRMFEVLMKVEQELIYYQFDVPSMYVYCVELLELSPSVAKDFICVVRKSLELPELAAAVRSKKISIFKAKKICSVINSSNFKEWIDLAIDCSTRTVEKAVAQANPKEAVIETVTYASEDRLEFKIGVSEQWLKLLNQTKDRLSQKLKRTVSSEEALLILMQEDLAKNDPIEKAKRALAKVSKRQAEQKINESKMKDNPKHEKNNSLSIGQLSNRTRYVPSPVEHQVNLRDQLQCTYIDSKGRRCESRRWLHKHHIQHFADGGDHSVENLETLCSGHHRMKHLSVN